MIRVIILATLLGGCVQTETPTVCDAGKVQSSVGSDFATAEAMLRQRSGAAKLRAVGPGDMMTMEIDPARLAVRTDAAGRILSLACG